MAFEFCPLEPTAPDPPTQEESVRETRSKWSLRFDSTRRYRKHS